MKKYRIYSKPEVVPQIVSVGWSMSAFAFGGFWAIFNKLYRFGIGVIILYILFYIVMDSFEFDNIIAEMLEIFIWTSIHIIFGLKGNRWVELNFIQKGYQLQDTVESNSYQEALSILKAKLDRFDKEYRYYEYR